MSQNVYLSKLFVETEKGNQLMSQICPQAYAYLPWKPYILDTEEEEALFTRDVINYYSVIGDSFNYFWHDHIIFLQEKYCDFKEKLKEGKNNYYEIQHMRTFLSHRFDKRNIKYFEAYCKFIESNQSVDDFISENENDINFILFSGINWKKANENLYKKTCYIVHTYNDIL